MYQLPVESWIVTLSPFRSTLTTLLSESALLRIFRDEAVTLPVLASAAQQGSRHSRRTRTRPAFHFLTLLTCLSTASGCLTHAVD